MGGFITPSLKDGHRAQGRSIEPIQIYLTKAKLNVEERTEQNQGNPVTFLLSKQINYLGMEELKTV